MIQIEHQLFYTKINNQLLNHPDNQLKDPLEPIFKAKDSMEIYIQLWNQLRRRLEIQLNQMQ